MSTRIAPSHWTRLRRSRLSRRSLLRASARAGVGAAGLALVGCSDDADVQPDPQQAQQQTATQQDAAQDDLEQQSTSRAQAQQQSQSAQQSDQSEPPPGPRRGGIIRAWLPIERHDRWDPHRSRFRYTQAIHSLMYNRLIRPASVSSGELEPDLCALPEMPEELTYIFTLDPGAVFWNQEPTNGRAVTGQDIIWNVQRQLDALDASDVPDPYFFRRAAYQRTLTQEATSDTSVTFTTFAPDATYLSSVHASPFAWITSPEAAERYGDDWRDDPSDIRRSSGTGPYTPRPSDGFEITLARSENWWRPDSAWADGIVFTSGDANSIGSLYEIAEFDRADFPLTNDAVEALREQFPEHPRFEIPLAAPVEMLVPLSADAQSLLADPRVAHAVNIAIDRPQLLERLYRRLGRVVGPIQWFFEGWSFDRDNLDWFAGYRPDRAADLADVTELIDAAGVVDGTETLPLVVADLFEGFFPGSGEAVRAMIADATGLEVELEHRPFAEAIDQLRGGERFCFLGWGPAPQQADPTDTWRRTLHSSGNDHWSDDTSADLDELIDAMSTTFALEDRQRLAGLVQERLLSGDAHQWRVNLVSGIQLGIHQPWLNPDPRLFEYAWSTDRLSNAWVDTTVETYPSTRELPPLEEETTDGG